METIFVYGTLREASGPRALLRGCRSLGPAVVRGVIYDVDHRFPALVPGGAGEVHGELWRCPRERLAELDAYEGVGDGLYRRERVEVGGEVAWTYVAGAALRAYLVAENRIPSGRWRRPS